MQPPHTLSAVIQDGWTAELDLLNLSSMPCERREFLQSVRQLNRDYLAWSLAQKRAFNKIWSHLERIEKSAPPSAPS
jgi:hypothetical protein